MLDESQKRIVLSQPDELHAPVCDVGRRHELKLVVIARANVLANAIAGACGRRNENLFPRDARGPHCLADAVGRGSRLHPFKLVVATNDNGLAYAVRCWCGRRDFNLIVAALGVGTICDDSHGIQHSPGKWPPAT